MNLTALIVGLTFFVQFNIMIGEKRLKSELQEIQRYGRNKSTVVNQTYINGGQYRSKFDKISDDKLLNRKASKFVDYTYPSKQYATKYK